MTQELDISLLHKVKEFLQVTDDLSSIELLRLLKDHRKRIHPDKFTEEHAKKEAEEKFKELGTLIDELDRFMQIEKLSRGAKELALYEPLYDNVALQKDIDEANEKIKSLEASVNVLQQENDDLKKSVEQKQTSELEKEALELKQMYKPSTQKLASLGILLLLSATIATMTKIEDVNKLVKKYAPIEDSYINTVTFGIFIFMLVLVIKQYIENKMLARRTAEVCSPLYCKAFLFYFDEVRERQDNKPRTFTESDALAFISGKDTRLKRFLSFIGFRMFQVETDDKLKNYFINTLLNKKLIDIQHAKDLDRVFSVRDGKSYYYWNA